MSLSLPLNSLSPDENLQHPYSPCPKESSFVNWDATAHDGSLSGLCDSSSSETTVPFQQFGHVGQWDYKLTSRSCELTSSEEPPEFATGDAFRSFCNNQTTVNTPLSTAATSELRQFQEPQDTSEWVRKGSRSGRHNFLPLFGHEAEGARGLIVSVYCISHSAPGRAIGRPLYYG